MPDKPLEEVRVGFQHHHLDHRSGQDYWKLYAYDEDTPNWDVVGYLDYSEFEGKIYIDMVFVKPEFRRQGIGTAMMQEMKRKATEEGSKIMHGLQTEEGAALYESMQPEQRKSSKWIGRNCKFAGPPQGTYGPVYHGSRVKNLKAFDPEKEGTGIVSMGVPKKGYYGGFFFSNDREAAMYYADLGEEDNPDDYIVTAYLTMNNPLLVEDPEKHPRHYIEQAKRMSAGIEEYDITTYGGGNRWYYLAQNPDYESAELNDGPFQTEGEAEQAGRRALSRHNEEVPTRPYDGVILKDKYDGDRVSDIYVVFDVNQIQIVDY